MKKKLELKEKNPSELTDLLREKREEVRTHRFSVASGRGRDGNAMRSARADVARLMTELTKRSKTEN